MGHGRVGHFTRIRCRTAGVRAGPDGMGAALKRGVPVRTAPKTTSAMASLPQDIRYAVRLLVKQKGFTAAALLTLAVCIGANAAMFSVVNAVLIQPLPFDGAERLVTIYNSYPRAGLERGGAAAPDYYDRRELPALEDVALLQGRGMIVGESGRPERVMGMAVTPSFFPMLGVLPVEGRVFLPEEGEPGNEQSAVLSWGLWQEQYGGEASAVGGTIRISDVDHTIVGVMPRDFVFRDPAVRLWIPLAFTEAARSDNARHSNAWEMVARLRPGATIEQAQQQVNALNANINERLPQLAEVVRQAGFSTVVAEYRSDLTREVRGTLWLLQGGVLLVLLIGCVNIANLVLVRATTRRRELATRAALGAHRSRLARQLITESVVLAIAGGLLGLLGAGAAVRGFAAFAIERLPRGTEVALDATTFLVALLVSALAGMLFGALPIARLLRSELSAVIREGGRSATGGRGTNRWLGGLVVAQVALAFTVLVGAGLLMTSFARTLAVDPGFEPAGVLTASLQLPVTRYPDVTSRRQFADRLLERVSAMPGVNAAAVADNVPFSGGFTANAITPEGHTPAPDDPLIAPVFTRVSADYFEAMGIDVQAGRAFSRGDVAGATPVAIVDRYLAERFWPGRDPIGKRIAQGAATIDGTSLQYMTVVGVVAESRVENLTGEQALGHVYVPLPQLPSAGLGIVLRTEATPEAMTGTLRAAVTALDPDLAIYDVRSMEERLAHSVATDRLRTILLAGFGTLALLLAAIGLYGVLAYSVAQRRPEIGIRMALGSSARAIFGMVVRQGARLVVFGLVVGVATSLIVGRMARGLLYGVEPGDPLVLAGVLMVLVTTALAACVLPARRAMRVDPMVAIREGS
jgi:putative ABC transport system permease protein